MAKTNRSDSSGSSPAEGSEIKTQVIMFEPVLRSIEESANQVRVDLNKTLNLRGKTGQTLMILSPLELEEMGYSQENEAKVRPPIKPPPKEGEVSSQTFMTLQAEGDASERKIADPSAITQAAAAQVVNPQSEVITNRPAIAAKQPPEEEEEIFEQNLSDDGEELLMMRMPKSLDKILENSPEARAQIRAIRYLIRGMLGSSVLAEQKRQYVEERAELMKKIKKNRKEIEAISESSEAEVGRQRRNLLNQEIELNKERKNLERKTVGLSKDYVKPHPIGEGAFGVVYRAEDAMTGEPVVLKLIKDGKNISEDVLIRLAREANALITLGAKNNILKGFFLKRLGPEGIPGIPESAGTILIETELIDGKDFNYLEKNFRFETESVKQKANDNKPIKKNDFPLNSELFKCTEADLSAVLELYLDEAKSNFYSLPKNHIFSAKDAQAIMLELEKVKSRVLIDLFAQACDGMAEAHKSGVLHRDIKLNNMMVDNDGNLSIIDWGLVKQMQAEEDEETRPKGFSGKEISQLGQVIGTPLFMSPEAAEGKKLSSASDIWSMGVALAISLTDIRPFDSDNPLSLLGKISKYDQEGLNKIEEKLKDKRLLFGIIKKALAKKPKDRFESMDAFHDALQIYNALESAKAFEEYLEDTGEQWAEEHPDQEFSDDLEALKKERNELTMRMLENANKTSNITIVMEEVDKAMEMTGKIRLIEEKQAVLV